MGIAPLPPSYQPQRQAGRDTSPSRPHEPEFSQYDFCPTGRRLSLSPGRDRLLNEISKVLEAMLPIERNPHIILDIFQVCHAENTAHHRSRYNLGIAQSAIPGCSFSTGVVDNPFIRIDR